MKSTMKVVVVTMMEVAAMFLRLLWMMVWAVMIATYVTFMALLENALHLFFVCDSA